MKIRTDPYDTSKVVESTSSFMIMAEDGRPLYHLTLQKDGKTLEISCYMTCRVNEELLDNELIIMPNSRGNIYISRKGWES